MKTFSIIIKLTRALCNTRKAVIIDSGFCFLKGIFKMKMRGVYVSALIKKRLYWPRGVHGDIINEYFTLNKIGGVGCLSGEWDDIEVNIFVMKEPNYNIIMMLKYSVLTVPGGQNDETRIFHR